MRFVLATAILLSVSIKSFTQRSEIQSELVMSMTQRSLVIPGYLSELKALIAKQAYNFWSEGTTEPYVSHLDVYSALHYANKYLSDSSNTLNYNEVGLHDNRVTCIKFGKDPTTYYSSSADGTILKWNLEQPKSIPEIIYKGDHIIRSIDISDDGSLILAAFYQTGLALISLENEGKDITIIEDPEPIQTAIFIPGEQKYLSVSKTGELKIKGATSPTSKVGSTTLKVNELTVDKNDGTIYAGTDSGTLEAWTKPYNIQEGNVEGILKDLVKESYFGYKLGTYAINCLDISPDGRILAMGRERGDVILWDIEARKIDRVISSHNSAITDIDFHPDGNMLLTTSRDKTARLWDLNESKKLPIFLDDHSDWVYAGSFDPSGKVIITGCGDQYIRTWPVNPKELADRICTMLQRNMTEEEWSEFVGKTIPYQMTCN